MRCDLCNKEITDNKWVEYEDYPDEDSMIVSYYTVKKIAHNDCYQRYLSEAYKSKPFCYHRWVDYVGFSETYKYCEICQEKRRD